MRLESAAALRTLATSCAGIAGGERVLIVTDTGAEGGIVELLAAVVEALGAEVTVVSFHPAELPGDEPPAAA